MKNEQLAAQLRLSASILETGHPWEFRRAGDDEVEWMRAATGSIGEILDMFTDGYEIRLALATPGDSRHLHNPDNLTAEQVGAGRRLLLKEECDGRYAKGFDLCWWSQCFSPIGGIGWAHDEEMCNGRPSDTLSVPLSTPWPEAKVEPKLVPLEAKDVPPGSAFRINLADTGVWHLPITVQPTGVHFASNLEDGFVKRSWNELMQHHQINRSIPLTGKWDADAWMKCEKEAV